MRKSRVRAEESSEGTISSNSQNAKRAASCIWTLSDTAIAEILGDTAKCAGLIADLKKDYERYFFIPWSQWPIPAKRLADEIYVIIGILPRRARHFRVYAVPDEIAALCVEYSEWKDGTHEYRYRHLVHSEDAMDAMRKRLSAAIDWIEHDFVQTGKNRSINGIARCC